MSAEQHVKEEHNQVFGEAGAGKQIEAERRSRIQSLGGRVYEDTCCSIDGVVI